MCTVQIYTVATREGKIFILFFYKEAVVLSITVVTVKTPYLSSLVLQIVCALGGSHIS